MVLNQRGHVVSTGAGASEGAPPVSIKRRHHVLEEFPEPRLECVVVQWESFKPSVFVQVKRDPHEPIQFPGKRPAIPGNADLPRDKPSALEFPLADFVDASTGLVFGKEAFNADIVFSQRAFMMMQPEPDLVLPAQDLWECRAEALQVLKLRDEEGFGLLS